MNDLAWEALERSAAFGVELHNQTYNGLRAAAAAAVASAGFSDAEVREAGAVLNQQEADMEAREAAEVELENERNKQAWLTDTRHQSLVTASLSLLPRYDYEANTFEVAGQKTLQALLDTVVWIKAPQIHDTLYRQKGELMFTAKYYPFYLLGYQYPTNRALVAAPLSTAKSNFTNSPFSFPPPIPLLRTTLRITDSDEPSHKRPYITSDLFVYSPGKADAKDFKAFMQQDVHLLSPEERAAYYDRKSGTYKVSNESRVYLVRYSKREKMTQSIKSMQPVSSAATYTLGKQNPLETADALHDFGTLDLGMVRLMTHFDLGETYIGLLRDTRLDYIGNIALSQQLDFVGR